MQANLDEADLLKQDDPDDLEWKMSDHGKELLKRMKARLFAVFFRVNGMKVAIPKHYHVLIIAIETFHLLSIILNDGFYSELGPYGKASPWNLGQSQWLIDLCWAFRLDRFLRTNLSHFMALLSVVGSLVGVLAILCFFLGYYRQTTSLTNFACKGVKVLITLFTNILFIPVCDMLSFGIKCSLESHPQCLSLPLGYLPLVLFSLYFALYLGVSLLCSMFYYDLCMICGSAMARPHPRFKILRLMSYTTLIVVYYFVDIRGRVIVFLITAAVIGSGLCYVYAWYIPYYHRNMGKIRLIFAMVFSSAVYCMLLGEFCNTTNQTGSSISLLFYFITPGLLQIVQLLMNKRSQILASMKFQQISNVYMVEIKGRVLVQELESAKLRSIKSMFSNGEEELDPSYEPLRTLVLTELECLYLEAFRKFPNSGYLYLWSGLLQLHVFKNYIRAMVQCFKGLALSNKLDAEFALSYFRRTSETFYKANMRDDAYEFVQFEKSIAIAKFHDEIVTRSQLHFWTELESKTPHIGKLMKLATELTNLVQRTKSDYEYLLKLNGKSSVVMKMFGNFLMSLNGYADLGQRYLQKAESQDNPENVVISPFISSTAIQSLSFFDPENAILTVSGDFETVGEIHKVTPAASGLFEYPQAEFVGRNISLLIPEPFASIHDAGMKQFHEVSKYSMVDQPSLTLFFVTKKGYIIEARTLIKVVPNGSNPPFFLAAIKPETATEDIAMVTMDFAVTALSIGFSQIFELGAAKLNDQRLNSLIPNFEEMSDKMMENWVNFELTNKSKLAGRIEKLTIGKYEALILRIRRGKLHIESDIREERSEISIHTVQPPDPSDNPVHDNEDIHSKSEDESESESESYSDDEDYSSSDSEPESKVSQEQSKSHSKGSNSHHISFPESATPGQSASETDEKHLIKKGIRYSEEPDIVYVDEEQTHSIAAQSQSPAHSGINSSDNEESIEIQSKDEQVEMRSASSKGSSMATTAQFNKAVKALITFEFGKIGSNVIRFKVTLFLTIVLLIASSVTTFKVIENAVGFNEELSHYVNLVGHLRLNAHSLSYYTRMIFLIDHNLLSNANRSRYVEWLNADAEEMHSINLQLYKQFKLLENADKRVYFQEEIPVWVKEGNDTRSIKSNLFDATSNLVVQAFLLQNESSQFSFSNRRVFYLYRNGIGETLQYLNHSAHFYVNAAQRGISEQRLIAIMLILVSAILLVGCASLAIIPTIRSLERSKRELWEMMFEVPRYVCRLMRGKCVERAKEVNEASMLDNEDITIGEKEDTGDEGGNEDSQRDKPKELKSRKEQKTERFMLSSDRRQRKLVYLKLLSFMLINIVYFYLIYYTGFDASGQTLQEEPITIDWASRRRHLSRAVNHWILESLLENVTDVGYKYVVTEGQFLGTPKREAKIAIDELQFVESALIFGEQESGLTFSNLRSQEHDNLLFINACIAPLNRSQTDCSTVADKALAQGLHSALGTYMTLARTVLLKISMMQQKGEYSVEDVKRVLSMGEMPLLRSLDECYLYDPLEYSSILYESDFSLSQSSMVIWQNLLISLYVMFAVLFYLFVYHPMIHKVRITQLGQDAKDSWSMCALLPQEYQEEFKQLNVIVKERRDRFKWR